MAERLISAACAHAERTPDRRAVEAIGGEGWTWSQVFERAQAIVGWLDEHVECGGVIMLYGPGGGAFWASTLAVIGSGRRLLPVGSDCSETETKAIAMAQGIDAALCSAPCTVDFGVDAIEVGAISSGAGSLDRAQTGSLLLRSSGSTGNPAVALRASAALDRVAETLVEVLELSPSDRVLAALPMHHAYGIEHAVLAPIMAGAEVIWQPGFELTRSAELLQTLVTVYPAVPVTLDAAARLDSSRSRLRLAYTAGSALPEQVRTLFEAKWKVPVGDLYGATELGTISWGVDGEARAVRGVSIKTSPEGELLVKSDAMFEGYLDRRGDQVRPGEAIDGHFRTGDLGRIDDGVVHITGRLKAQFDVGGLKVNPEDVEAVLQGCPGLHEVAVLPLVLTETVTRVRLVVVSDASPEAIRAFARATLAPHLRPRQIEVVDRLPRTASGKIKRYELLDLGAEATG